MQIYPKNNNIDSKLSVRFQQILFWGFTYTILSGILRKWVFFSGMLSNVLLFGQLILPLILAWQCSKIDTGNKKKYTSTIIIYCITLSLMAANPLNHTVFHGIIGFVIHAGFWCVLLVYLNIASPTINLKQLDNFLIFILILETVLASIQYNLPSDHILNRYAREMEAVAIVGENIRVTGTFSYLGGMGALAIFYSFFAWYLLNQKKIALFLTVLIMTGYITLLTGSRTAFFSFIIITIIAIYENREVTNKLLKRIISIGVLIMILTVFYNPFESIEKAWGNFEERTTSLNERGESSNRIYKQFMSAFLYHGDQPLFGSGLGSDYQGTNSVFGTSQTRLQYGFTEEEGERIVFEGGYTLLLIRFILFIIVLSAMPIKTISKWILFILFFPGLLVFHTYMTFFVAMGFMWINQSKLVTAKETTQ